MWVVGADLLVFGGGEELLFEGDAAVRVYPDDDVGEHVADALVLGDEIELGGGDHLLAVVDVFGAEVGDGPGFGQVGAAASEAEGQEAIGLGLVIFGGDDGEVVGAGIVDAEEAVAVLDEAGRWGEELGSHYGLTLLSFDEDAAGLGGGLADDALVEVLAHVGFG